MCIRDRALADGVASQYPNMFGIPQLKQAASRFIKAFLDIDIPAQGCVPTVGKQASRTVEPVGNLGLCSK